MDIAIFFDDDFFPLQNYIEEAEKLMDENSDIAVVTGTLIADGARSAGISIDEGRELLKSAAPTEQPRINDVYSAYGCNMVVKLSITKHHCIEFDEKLPLYGWLEDMDFSRKAARYGRIVKANTVQGVHLGTKTGRISGVKYGYSQIVNPAYLYSKGTVSFHVALLHAGRNFVANSIRSIWSQKYIDHFGRLRGNLIGVWHIVNGCANPEHIHNL